MVGCPVCNDTGEFKVMQYDDEGNRVEDSIEKCECQNPKPKKRVKNSGEVVTDADNNQ